MNVDIDRYRGAVGFSNLGPSIPKCRIRKHRSQAVVVSNQFKTMPRTRLSRPQWVPTMTLSPRLKTHLV